MQTVKQMFFLSLPFGIHICQHVYGKKKLKVALLNIGEEESKKEVTNYHTYMRSFKEFRD